MSITFAPSYDPADDDDGVAINLSNVNALALLDALDLPVDYCGSVHPTTLIAKIDQVLAGHDDGVAPLEAPGLLFGSYVENMIDYGRRPGYFQERAAQLLDVARSAAALGRNVEWA